MRSFLIVAALLAVACGNEKRPPAPASSVDGLVSKLKAAGLSPGELQATKDPTGGDAKCKGGEVSGVAMTVCEYADAATAKQHESPGLTVIGEHTGAALAEGKLLLLVADQNNADKDGKKIDQITRAFRGH